jgi:carbon monoxide dehydrogenase subunit G
MQSVNYAKTVEIPFPVMWDFIKDFSNWAPMVKGYQSHEVINDKESIWVMKGEFASFSRITKFNTAITEWVEKEKVAFEMKGVNEPVTGYGIVQLSSGNGNDSNIVAELGFNAGGILGPLLNRMIKPWVKTVAEELVEKLVAGITPEKFESEFWPK